jgi:hypothetical protein
VTDHDNPSSDRRCGDHQCGQHPARVRLTVGIAVIVLLVT